MTKKRPNALEMLAQVMARMATQESPASKLPPAPQEIQTIYQPGGK